MSDRLKRILTGISSANTVTVTVLAFVLSVVIGGILMILSDQHLLTEWGYFFQHPTDAVSDSWTKVSDGYVAMFHGAVFDPHAKQAVRPLENTIVDATPLVFAGLAVALPFRAGLFNIGGQSQLIIGAVCATWVGFTFSLPMPLHVLLVIIAGILGGALVGGLTGLLKARFGAHEVISSIMLNNIALGVLAWLIKTKAFHDPHRQDAISKPVKNSALLPAIQGSSPEVNLSTVLAIIAVLVVWWLMTRSTLGFRLRALGSNPDAARTAGISVSRNQVYAMLLAGGLMGLVAVTQISGTLSASHAMTTTLDNGIGFTGITVALLGRGKPVGVALAALLFGALDAGGVAMEASTTPTVPHDVVTVVQAVIVVFVAAPKLVQEIFRLRDVRRDGGGAAPSVAPATAVDSAAEAV
ncbi:inner-membrane translocator [Catenulispora acidiphila DSM 44928]|uniref:Inner-membrane translocator n=1 Tax=Catenulispora acidiphila (strain DSM 44928 / JCM 14897 / NBRC 102108 / NRRL B-24433 / ID139908) TaxID=479433 RepID=C7Q0U1_CATAD|nr:ABC transporter permease [Catenulispora acidiphila]ACU69719.1 inner-membrane translocator [Catenulispora acidiphila DSM 44928]